MSNKFNIVYYLDIQSDIYVKLGMKSVASARKWMPNAHIVLICPDEIALPTELSGQIDQRFPIVKERGFYTKSKQKGYSDIGLEEGLYIDVDTIFMASVSNVFDFLPPFEIAIAHRNIFLGKNYPYNSGVVFSRSSNFFKALHEMNIHKSAMIHEEGFGRLVQSNNYKVKILNSIYNWTPTYPDDIPKDVKILHYKGSRKSWMLAK